MFKFFRKKFAIATMMCAALFMTSCDEEMLNEILSIFVEMLGYDPSQENWEDKDEVLDGNDVSNTNVSWERYCPPVGNQGQYGTCVAWATAYGLKTTLNMKDGTWDHALKNQPAYQCSPVDVWHSMRSGYSSEVSSGCGGSSFDPAFKAIQSKGVATMATVPFTNMKMTCDNVAGKGLSNNKITSYRTIAYSAEMSSNGTAYGMTAENIKAHLQEGPLVIGAKLGDNFMAWNSSNVIKSDTKTYKGQHAYHAMMLVGYDDSKKAFRLQNSWGATDWGDNGYIWVDYTFFTTQFCFGVWGATNAAKVNAAPRSATGNDVAVKIIADKELADGNRSVEYTFTNKGTSVVSTSDYDIIYLLFKSRDLSEKFIVMENKTAKNVNPGETVTLKATYQIPADATAGNYYTALIADPYETIGDDKPADNFSYLAGQDLAPLYVAAGRMNSNGTSIVNTIVDSKHANAYRNSEVTRSLIRMKNKR